MMSLTINDIAAFEPGTIILYYSGELGWCKAAIQRRGLNYVDIRGIEGHRALQEWQEDIHGMLTPNRYHLWIPPPKKKPARIWWWIRKVLVSLIKKIPQ
jgi:hypothetical protein